MSFYGILAFGTLAVAVIGACVAFASGELTKEEKRRQEQMKDEYNSYEKRKEAEYQEKISFYKNVSKNNQADYYAEIARYEKELKERRKKANRVTYDKIDQALKKQYEEKNKLLEECRDIIKQCSDSIKEMQGTYVRYQRVIQQTHSEQ